MFDGLVSERVSKARRVLQDQLVSLGRRSEFITSGNLTGWDPVSLKFSTFLVQAKATAVVLTDSDLVAG